MCNRMDSRWGLFLLTECTYRSSLRSWRVIPRDSRLTVTVWSFICLGAKGYSVFPDREASVQLYLFMCEAGFDEIIVTEVANPKIHVGEYEMKVSIILIIGLQTFGVFQTGLQNYNFVSILVPPLQRRNASPPPHCLSLYSPFTGILIIFLPRGQSNSVFSRRPP